MGRVIDVKQFVADKKKELSKEVELLLEQGIDPTLRVIQIGNNDASNKYIGNKVKVGKEIGIDVIVTSLSEDVTQEELEERLISSFCPTIVQCPVPKHIDLDKAIKSLSPELDVDGFTIEQKGLLFNEDSLALVPATALGVYELLDSITELRGKDVVIVNRSHLIGKPLSQLLTNANATVTLCHSYTEALISKMRGADIVVTGCGRRGIFDERWVATDSIVIDCSMDKKEGILGVGDFNKESILEDDYNDIQIASGYGATGLLTTCYLMHNVVKAYKNIYEL